MISIAVLFTVSLLTWFGIAWLRKLRQEAGIEAKRPKSTPRVKASDDYGPKDAGKVAFDKFTAPDSSNDVSDAYLANLRAIYPPVKITPELHELLRGPLDLTPGARNYYEEMPSVKFVGADEIDFREANGTITRYKFNGETWEKKYQDEIRVHTTSVSAAMVRALELEICKKSLFSFNKDDLQFLVSRGVIDHLKTNFRIGGSGSGPVRLTREDVPGRGSYIFFNGVVMIPDHTKQTMEFELRYDPSWAKIGPAENAQAIPKERLRHLNNMGIDPYSEKGTWRQK